MNQVTLIGNVTSDPKIYGDGGVGRLRVAVNSGREESKQTLYITCKLFGRQAGEINYFSIVKGDKVYVNGRLVTEEFTREDQTAGSETVIYVNDIQKIYKPVRIEQQGGSDF
jgi:single stranded DNA-binding protein